MTSHNLDALNLLTLPVWIVSPFSEELLFANRIAREVMRGYTFSQLRKGVYSTHAQNTLPKYITDLRNHQDIVEILTVPRGDIYGDRLMLCIIHDITEQRRLEQELEHAALHDALTGLLNRRQFYKLTEQGQAHHLPLTQDYSLLLIDTDRFKSINDLYGHLKGDEVLCALARTLKSCARKEDLVFRWGGEEFVLLLPRTPLETALSLAESLRASVAKISLPGLPRFTVSIGVAQHEPNESTDELFKRVDAALYRAKNDGRNRVLAA